MKNKLTCIITDDEPFAREGLQGYVEKTTFLELSGMCEDGLQLTEMLIEKKPDIVFLDIEMPHITGVELLRSLGKPPKVIFTTAYEQYALQGYELDILDYLLKPISYERFLKAACKAYDYFNSTGGHGQDESFIFVKTDGRLEKIPFDEVLYIEGMENYIAIHLEGRKVITHSTIKAFCRKLPAKKFLQVHKSFIVAIDKVKTIDGGTLLLGKYQVPLSRNFRELALQRLMGT
jgi:two-component system, LytTR family, response regulator